MDSKDTTTKPEFNMSERDEFLRLGAGNPAAAVEV